MPRHKETSFIGSIMLDSSRRGFIAGLASLLAAPAIVKASSLMPVKVMAPEYLGDVVSFDRKLAIALGDGNYYYSFWEKEKGLWRQEYGIGRYDSATKTMIRSEVIDRFSGHRGHKETHIEG